MKKLVVVLLMMFFVAGCTDTKRNQTLFVKDDEQYALCVDGQRKTAYLYDKYVAVGDQGFLVYQGKKTSYLSNTGKTLIDYQSGKTLQNIGQLIVSQDKDKNVIIYNSEGKQLYKSSKKVKIAVYGLPVIYQDKQYAVLDTDGNETGEYGDIKLFSCVNFKSRDLSNTENTLKITYKIYCL